LKQIFTIPNLVIYKTKSRVDFVTIIKQIAYFLTRAHINTTHWQSSKILPELCNVLHFHHFHQTSSLDIINLEYLINQNTGTNNRRVPDATNDPNIFLFLNLILLFLRRLDLIIQDFYSRPDAVVSFSLTWPNDVMADLRVGKTRQ